MRLLADLLLPAGSGLFLQPLPEALKGSVPTKTRTFAAPGPNWAVVVMNDIPVLEMAPWMVRSGQVPELPELYCCLVYPTDGFFFSPFIFFPEFP